MGHFNKLRELRRYHCGRGPGSHGESPVTGPSQQTCGRQRDLFGRKDVGGGLGQNRWLGTESNESPCRLGPKARTPFVVRPQIRRTETFVVAKRVERERPGGPGNQQQSNSWRSSAPPLARKALISARLPLERGLRRARDAGVDWPAVRGRAGSLTRFAGCRPIAVA
jgi:hypothetical protein